MRAIRHLWWLWALVSGCPQETRHLDWEVAFTSPSDQAAATALEARILRDGCGGVTELWSAEIPLGGTTRPPGPPHLAAGTYGFAVEARDSTCTRIARGCTDLRLPRAEGSVVRVELGSDLSPSPECEATSCSEGVCVEPDAGAPVDGGAPDAGPCLPGTGDCNFDLADGCETALDTLLDCGACGTRCELDHATVSCSTGSCAVAACDTGFADCDGTAANGCEVELGTVAHCAGCTDVCNVPHATSTCSDGACRFGGCHPGWGDCDGMEANGCEQSLASASHCGACLAGCGGVTPLCGVLPGGARGCVALCEPPAATACGSSCFDLATDPLSCGACDNACNAVHGTSVCEASACRTGSCDTGWADCDGMPGCEGSIVEVGQCGSCGTSCVRPEAVTSCGDGTCTIDGCRHGWGDCNGAGDDGCEAELGDPLHCGACGMVCGGSMPVCGTRGGDPACLPTCVDPAPDRCGDRCVDLGTDEAHCGDCDTTCALPGVAESACLASACRIGRCQDGLGDCDADATTGCETPLGADVANCGGCGTTCPGAAHATPVCSGGSCDTECDAGFGDCDGMPENGCETDLQTDGNHCGSCGRTCTMRVCVAGRCERA